jgi:hypothetical protein
MRGPVGAAVALLGRAVGERAGAVLTQRAVGLFNGVGYNESHAAAGGKGLMTWAAAGMGVGGGIIGGITAVNRWGRAAERVPSRVLSVEEAGGNLAKQVGTNRVSVMTPSGRMQIDLAGKAHFDKALGVDIPSPHVKFQELNFGPNGKSNLSPGTTQPATMTDIRTARKIIERRGQ